MHEKDTFKTFEGVFFVAIILAEVANMWVEYNPNPCHRSVGDCAVRALTKALNVSWDEAYEMMNKKGYELCDMPSGNAVWGAVLREHGFHRATLPGYCPDCYTADDFCHDNPKGIYVLGFGTHVATVVNGNIYDSWDSRNEIPQYFWLK